MTIEQHDDQGCQTVQRIGGRLLRIRSELELSQRALAAALGISPSYMAEIEAGKVKPNADVILGVALKLPQVSLDWLVTGRGEWLASGDPRDPDASQRLAAARDADRREDAGSTPAVATTAFPAAWGVVQSITIHGSTVNILCQQAPRVPEGNQPQDGTIRLSEAESGL